MKMLPILLAAAALVLCACTKVEEVPVTQVLLSVTSDLSDATSYQVRVTDETETVEGATVTINKMPPFTFALLPAAKRPVLRNLLIVSALDASNNVLAVAKKLVILVERETSQVEVNLTQACRGRTCDAGFSCAASVAGSAECLAVQLSTGTKVDPSTLPGSDMMMEGMTPGDDGGTRNGNDGGGVTSGAAGGMAGSPSMGGGAAAGGNAAGGTASGGTASGGTASGGTASGGTAGGGTMADGGASMGGGVDAGVDAGPPPECDATRACSTGYTCVSNKCVSRCAQTTCDPNATCSLNASGAPVCACNSGFLSMTGTGGAVMCMRLQACTDLRCDTNATCEAVAGAQPRCACRSGYTGSGTTCAPVSCPALTITNGTVDTNGGTFGQTATYTCLNGYDRTGGSTRRCEANATWSGTAPTCVAHNCGTLAPPARGNVTTTGGTTFGAVARFTCTSPFRPSPENATRTCTANGWSGSTPSCVGCGDGELQAGEQCDWANLVQDPWTCTTSCQTTGYYKACVEDVHCDPGLNCFSGACTSECGAGGVCPVLSSRAGSTSCQGSFACFVSCTRTQQCPRGNVCRGGFCQGCNRNAASNECPAGQVCIGESEAFSLGRCQ